MPKHWEILLQQSQISKQEQQQNPQAVLNALKYYTRADSSQKWMQPSNYDCMPFKLKKIDGKNYSITHILSKYNF